MTITTAAIARGTTWACFGLNVAVVVWDLTRQQYAAAALQSIPPALIAVVQALSGKLHLKLDAEIGIAVTQQRMQDLALRVMTEQADAGNLRVGVERAH
jgi:hypothetical protein